MYTKKSGLFYTYGHEISGHEINVKWQSMKIYLELEN